MKKTRVATLAIATLIGISIQPSARADGEFHFPVGLTYSQGAQDAINKILDAYEADWGAKLNNRIIIPVGLSFNPYYEWDSGLGVGMGLGPTIFVFGSLDDSSGNSVDTKFSCIIPIGADVRYTFFNTNSVSPYARAGFRYPIAGGDDIVSSQPGAFGAVGVEFWRTKKVGAGIEVGYDSSQVKIGSANYPDHNVTVAGFTASLFVVF